MKKEVWKPVVTHPEYEVSNHGRVRNAEGHLMAITKEHKGEAREVTLCDRGARDKRRLSRIVGAAHCPDYREHLRARYKDGDKSNCHASNLAWAPMSEITFRPTGDKQGASKLTWADVMVIRDMAAGKHHVDAILKTINKGRKNKVSIWTISSVTYFATWKTETSPDEYRKQAIKQYERHVKTKQKQTSHKPR